jgi:hypothetical protein
MRTLSAFLLLTGLGLADTITLRDGRHVNGSYVGGDARNVRFAVGDRVDNFRVEDITSISFGGDIGAPPPSSVRVDPPPPPREAPRPEGWQLAAGTKVTVRMIDSVDSQRDYVGKTYRASLDEPIIDTTGNTLVPRGTDCVIKLLDDKESGKIAGKTVLTLSLYSMQVNGKELPINSQSVTESSSSRGARSGKVIGGTAAAGAIIGAIAGGGKGAAIGAGAGAGAGTAVELATKGQKVHVPSETRLTFTLEQPARL